MSSDTAELESVGFGRGAPLSRLADGAMLVGNVADEPVLLVVETWMAEAERRTRFLFETSREGGSPRGQ